MVYSPAFKGCWAKVRRAQKHRGDLNALQHVLNTDSSNWPHLGLRYDSEEGEYVLFVSHVPDLGQVFDVAGIIAGDYFHNLRSALDYAIYELSLAYRDGTLENPEDPQFPICDHKTEFDRVLGEYLGQMNPLYHALVERYQPYKSLDTRYSVGLPFHPLQALRDFNNTDKHRLLNVTMLSTSSVTNPHPFATFVLTSGSLQGAFGDLSTGETLHQSRPVELGVEIQRAKLPRTAPDMDGVGYVTPTIAFQEGGRPAIPQMDKIGACVIRTIREFTKPPPKDMNSAHYRSL